MAKKAVLTVSIALLVVLAGCAGGGPADDGDTGDGDGVTDTTAADVGDGGANDDGSGGSSDGDGSSTGDGLDSGEWEPFAFDRPGKYTYDVYIEGEGEGTLVWEVTSIDDGEFTVAVNYDVGETQYESEVTGSEETVQQQLMMSPAGSLMMLTVITPGAWYSGRELELGTQWSYQTNEGSGSFAVTGTDSYGGVTCYTSEMKINGSVIHAGCFSPDHGLAPHSAYYDDEGNRQMEMTLVDYERRD